MEAASTPGDVVAEENNIAGESRQTEESAPWAAGSNCLAPGWRGRRFAHAFSVGSFCHAADVLRRLGFRVGAGPFDWIFSSPRVSAHCIADDFAWFLRRDQYEDVPEEARVVREANLCEHRYYREHFGLRFMFNHHRPTGDEDHAYLQRAVTRFRHALRAAEPTLLLLVSHEPLDAEHCGALLEALRGYGTDFLLVAVRFVPQGDAASVPVRTTPVGADFLGIELPVSRASNGVVFQDEEDNRRLARLLASFDVVPPPAVTPDTADDFDEAFYLSINRDVAAAVAAGRFASGWDHYQQFGRATGRSARRLSAIDLDREA